jgi:hypothetical protein
MNLDRTPVGAQTDMIEDWLQRVGQVQHHSQGFTVHLTPELMRDYAEWVAACQREAIAQVLECMPEGTLAKHCASAVRRMRGEH